MNTLIISLGSGYNKSSEYFGFSEELKHLGKVVTYSIDLKKIEFQDKNDPHLHRIEKEITDSSDVADFFKPINLSEYNNVIVCDSIHFNKKSAESDLFLSYLENQSIKPTYFHYISCNSQNPIFNHKYYHQSNINLPTISELFEDDYLINLISPKFQKQLEQLKKNDTRVLMGMLNCDGDDNQNNNQLLKLLFGDKVENCSNYLREKISQYVSNQIDLEKIGLKLEQEEIEKYSELKINAPQITLQDIYINNQQELFSYIQDFKSLVEHFDVIQDTQTLKDFIDPTLFIFKNIFKEPETAAKILMKCLEEKELEYLNEQNVRKAISADENLGDLENLINRQKNNLNYNHNSDMNENSSSVVEVSPDKENMHQEDNDTMSCVAKRWPK